MNPRQKALEAKKSEIKERIHPEVETPRSKEVREGNERIRVMSITQTAKDRHERRHSKSKALRTSMKEWEDYKNGLDNR